MACARRVSGGDVSSIVTLNVGGRIFTTYRATLLQYPDSMLAAMMGGSHQTCIVSGSVFIDRDPDLFEFILDFLRSGPNDFELPSEQRTCRSACVIHHHSHGSRVPTHPCVLPTRAAYISHTTSQLKSFPKNPSPKIRFFQIPAAGVFDHASGLSSLARVYAVGGSTDAHGMHRPVSSVMCYDTLFDGW
jgi:hypothetical protein